MKISFTAMTSTKGLTLSFDTDTKSYRWGNGIRFGFDLFYMPTNKDLYAFEKKLIKEGYEEIEVNNYGTQKGDENTFRN